MSEATAAALAALNQTLRKLTEAVNQIHDDLDRLGYPKEEADGTGKGHDS